MKIIEDFPVYGFDEGYDIETRVEVVGRDRARYRLDVFRAVKGNPDRSDYFAVRAYREERVLLDLAYPPGGTPRRTVPVANAGRGATGAASPSGARAARPTRSTWA